MNVEFIGGPIDGQRSAFPPDLLDFHDGPPKYGAVVGDGVHVTLANDPAIDAGHGRYVLTRSLTADGRLIYRFLAALPAIPPRTPDTESRP